MLGGHSSWHGGTDNDLKVAMWVKCSERASCVFGEEMRMS